MGYFTTKQSARSRAAQRWFPEVSGRPSHRSERMMTAIRSLPAAKPLPRGRTRFEENPRHWRDLLIKMQARRQRHCPRCKGTGEIRVSINEFEEDVDACPQCQRAIPRLDTDLTPF